MTINIVARQTGEFHVVSSADYLWSSDTKLQQLRLKELYQSYDLRCDCAAGGVMMHIRYLSKSDLYFVADNSGSPLHNTYCNFATVRAGRQIEGQPAPLTEFNPYRMVTPGSEREQSRKDATRSSTPRISTALVQRLADTLMTNSLVNNTFGKFVSFKDFCDRIKEAERNKAIKTPWQKDLTDIIYYGPQGLEYAKSCVRRLKAAGASGAVPVALWMAYVGAEPAHSATCIELNGQLHEVKKVHQPFSAGAPYVAVATVIENGIREIILYPIVSFKYVYPVHTEKQREWILDYMPKLFQTNAKRQKLVWVNKPLWPELSESGQLLLADFYYNQKAAGKRITDQIEV